MVLTAGEYVKAADTAKCLGVSVQVVMQDLGLFVWIEPNTTTSSMVTQLENINSTTISKEQWRLLSQLDQAVTTASSPEFAILNLGGSHTFGSGITFVDSGGVIGFHGSAGRNKANISDLSRQTYQQTPTGNNRTIAWIRIDASVVAYSADCVALSAKCNEIIATLDQFGLCKV